LGVSNYSGRQLQKLVDYIKFMGLDPCVVLQQQYSLLERHSDLDIIPCCEEEGVALVPYSVIAGGLLTGKFKRGDSDVRETVAGSRMAWVAEKPKERGGWSGTSPNVEHYRNTDEYWKLMEEIESIAKSHGKTQAQVATRWALQKTVVSSVVIGARTIQQLEDCMGAGTGWALTNEEMQNLDKLSTSYGYPPAYPHAEIAAYRNQRLRR